jgi:two-component system sensor histidine kinase UhpB
VLKKNDQSISNKLPRQTVVNEHAPHVSLEAVLNSSNDISIFSLDKNYCYTSFNHKHSQGMKEVWDVDIETGMNLLDCMHVAKLRNLAKMSIDRALHGEAFSEIQFQPGPDIYFEFSWNPVFQNKKVIGATAFIQDITRRKLTEEALKISEGTFRDLFENISDLICTHDLEGNILSVNPSAEKVLGYNLETLLTMKIQDMLIPETDDQYACYVASLLKDGYARGCIKARTCAGEERYLEFSNTLRSKAVKTPVVRGFAKDITERKLVEQALMESEERLKQGELCAKFGNWKINVDEKMVYASEGAQKIYGAYRGKITLDELKSFRLPEYNAMIDEALKRLIEENTVYDVDFKIRRENDGKIIDINSKAEYNAATRTIFGTIQDITERKQTENEIKRHQKFTEVLLHSIPTPVFFKDKQGRYMGCNEAFSQQTGFRSEDMVGKTVMELWPGDQAEIYHKKDLELMKEPVHQVYESKMKDKYGELRDVLFAKDVFYDETGSIAGIVGAYIDITESKRTEASKLEAQVRIMKIASQVPGVIFQFRLRPDGSSSFPYASESLYNIYNIRPDEVREDASIIYKKIHPDDYSAFTASILASAKNLTPWQHECRVKFENGTVRHIYGSSIPELEEDGSILWHGFTTDVTERKIAEVKIRQLSKAVEQSPVSIVITDTTGAIEYVNPKFVELTGYSFDEAIGKNPSILKSGYTSDEEYKKLWKTITRGLTWHGELRNKKKNGDLYWESATISPIINEQGKITHFLAVKEDITDRKKSEAEIERMAITLDIAPNAITVHDFDGNFLYSNERNLDIHGYSKEEFMKINLHQLDVPASQKLIESRIKELYDFGETNFEAAHFRKDGSIVPLEIFARLTNWGDAQAVLSMATDITERQASEQKLQEILKSYEFVNKATSDTIWEWDLKTDELKRNGAFHKTFGHLPGSMINTPEWAGKNIHPEDEKRVLGIIRNCIEKKLEHWQAEYRYRSADDTYRLVYDRAFVLFDNSGNPLRMYGAMTDLTEKQKLKEELAEQQLKLQKQLLEVNIQAHEEEKSELGKELHDNISQMLATIKMYLGLARAGRLIHNFDLIGKSYDIVDETIGELRNLSHSLVPPSLGEIGLEEALEELVNISNLLKKDTVKLIVDKKIRNLVFDKKIELMIYRIVQEQLNNINKYAQAKTVLISIKKVRAELHLTITDDGIGFDVTKKGKGIGLRNMANRVEYYSGTINIISAPGKGCTIKVSIPIDLDKKAI